MGYDRALKAINLEETDRIPSWEFVSHPEFQKYVTGIDPYKNPQKAALKLLEKVQLDLCGISIPLTDDPIEVGIMDFEEGQSSKIDASGHRVVRWGAGATWRWDWGNEFKSLEEVLEYDPDRLEYDDGYAALPIKNLNLSVEELAEKYNQYYHTVQNLVGKHTLVMGSYYKTLFMWFLMTFGWNLTMKLVFEERRHFEKLLEGFTRISQKVLKAWSMTDIKIIFSHDDICAATGPVFSPEFYRKYLYPRYQKIWDPLKKAGIKILFASDGNIERVYEDIFKAGADGIYIEHHPNLQAIVEKYGDSKFLAGGVDGRTLLFGGKKDVWKEVERVTKIAKECPGYFYCNSKHITHNIPLENVIEYFRACKKFGKRI